jgi:hypothetical protein
MLLIFQIFGQPCVYDVFKCSMDFEFILDSLLCMETLIIFF